MGVEVEIAEVDTNFITFDEISAPSDIPRQLYQIPPTKTTPLVIHLSHRLRLFS